MRMFRSTSSMYVRMNGSPMMLALLSVSREQRMSIRACEKTEALLPTSKNLLELFDVFALVRVDKVRHCLDLRVVLVTEEGGNS